MIVNWPASIIALVIASTYGVVSVFSPITILGIMARWTSYASERSGKALPSNTKRQVESIKDNPAEYKEIKPLSIAIIRATGLFCLLIAALLAVMIINVSSP
jgi:hypothetical protein